MIDLADQRPLYIQLAEAIKQKITRNQWTLGMMTPSENELAAEFQVSVGTVKKALGMLVQEGILFRRQGRGTFVASPDFSKSFIRFFRYGLPERDDSDVPGSHILSMTIQEADSKVAGRLHLQPDAAVVQIKRIRTLREIPFSFEEIFLPYQRFKGIEQLNLENKLLYPLYNKMFVTPIFWADEYLQPDVADAEVVQHLAVPKGSPVMCVERIAYTYEDIPVEWRRSIGRGDSFRYHIVIR